MIPIAVVPGLQGWYLISDRTITGKKIKPLQTYDASSIRLVINGKVYRPHGQSAIGGKTVNLSKIKAYKEAMAKSQALRLKHSALVDRQSAISRNIIKVQHLIQAASAECQALYAEAETELHSAE